ncbi:DUF805 domain-containing protein [Candidatus Mycalebacterium sp.]
MSEKLIEAEKKRKNSGLPLGLPWFLKGLRLYAVFGGRARRREYWFFLLWTFIITSLVAPTPAFFANIFFTIPTFAIQARRLHDIGKSAWLILWEIVLVILSIFLLTVGVASQSLILIFFGIGCCFIVVLYSIWFGLKNSEKGTNKYGKNPKGVN